MSAVVWLGLSLCSSFSGAFEIRILSPEAGQPVFGAVDFEAAIIGGTAAEVLFYVDRRLAGRRTEPPYRLRVDVGEENAEHRFEIVALGADGVEKRSLLVAPAIPVDLELEVELQQLYVTVTRQQRRVLDLTADDFEVFDNGRRQKLVTFARGDIPLAAVLLLDASNSMRGERLQAAVRGAETFIAELRELDQAKLLLFSDRLRHATPFTSFPEILRTGLGAVTASGSTALNDHLYLALERLEERQGRRVVILLSDGVDVTSVLRMSQVRAFARRSRAMIYWIRLGLPDPRRRHVSAWRDVDGHRAEIVDLERTVEESGGRILSLSTLDAIPSAFAEVLAELRDQYVLGYYPDVAAGDRGWHRVEVEVGQRGLEVRARAGYAER